jgi:hypothetical protein
LALPPEEEDEKLEIGGPTKKSIAKLSANKRKTQEDEEKEVNTNELQSTYLG